MFIILFLFLGRRQVSSHATIRVCANDSALDGRSELVTDSDHWMLYTTKNAITAKFLCQKQLTDPRNNNYALLGLCKKEKIRKNYCW